MSPRHMLRLVRTEPPCHSHGGDECGRPHCDGATCMQLPDGATCGDCLWIDTCCDAGETYEAASVCQYFPRRFVRNVDPGP